MALEHAFVDLGEIRPSDDPDARLMAAVHQMLQIESVEKGAPGLVFQSGGVAGDETGRVEHDGVAGEGGQLLHESILVKFPGVDLPEIGLDHAPGVICPPTVHTLLLCLMPIL